MAPKRARTVEGSCWPCRKRRVLCDLARPACSRCSSAHQLCEYSQVRLKWIDGVAARGKLAGRTLPVGPSIPPAVPFVITEDGLLLYFAHAVVPRFHLSLQSPNVDLAAITSDPVLQQAVIALANAHRVLDAHLVSDDVLVAKSRARLAALETFRKSLAADPTSLEDLFLANVFHCVLDGIIEPTDETAAMICHFQGGKALLSSGDCLEKLDSADRGLSSFALSVFATMDLVHSLLSGHEPFFSEAWIMSRSERHCWWGCLDTDDPFLAVLSILFRLARLGHQAQQSRRSVCIADLLSIQSALERIGHRCSSQPVGHATTVTDGPTSGSRQESWAALCSAYRATASIYMYRALCNLEPDHQLVQHAASEGVTAICKERLVGNIEHCMLFPILIIGSHCKDGQDRRRLLKILSSNASYLAFGSIQLMEQFLKRAWLDEDVSSTWWQCYSDIAYRMAVF